MITEIIAIHPCDENHQVVSIKSKSRDSDSHMKQPCPTCPWRKDAEIGAFPVEAYRHSAKTAIDGAMEQFSCHTAGVEKPKTCAGFLLKNSMNNVATRMALIKGTLDTQSVSDGGHELYGSYRDMAIANGVKHDDPAIKNCRADYE